MSPARGLLGIVVLVGIAWLLSLDRRRFPWKLVGVGLALQWALAWVVLRTETGKALFDVIGLVVTTILLGADEGADFVFGPLAGSHPDVAWPAIVGIKIMTTIIVVAMLSAIGYHYGILQRVVSAIAWVMKRTMGVSGAESLSGAANVFFGQTEAPLQQAAAGRDAAEQDGDQYDRHRIVAGEESDKNADVAKTNDQ